MFGDFDLDALMRQAQQMQADLERAQREVSEMSFTGEAGGDLVSVTLSGQGDLTAVTIKPEAVDPDDTETLGDLIIAAYRAAKAQADQAMASAMPAIPDMPGIPGLGG
ncbi:YbaB/EbfC family nucleoid-associated protein [Tessaracoccus defluvii]|uniref:Nucleoid-associated protein H9L22_17590 n=1 Tax=Tessaracoccus defluvii TaxID=1285901 RepID=A0A7H0H5S2_9ACTN|nr:YbaB/EbfC family nucleoid-associated protein [Tessaracoccus defluvii]QNP55888.1 YbaB/EbfC family nucleoid-associated protein [Tessaracoccus defluvii]